MTSEKVEVGYALKADADFGMLKEGARQGTIIVSKEMWEQYVKARTEFEKLHAELLQKMARKERDKLWYGK